MKRQNKEFKKAYWDATQNWEVPQPKLGLTPINKRNFKIWRLILHVAAEECYCVWTDCGRVGVEQHRVEREEGDFEQCFPCDKELLRDNSENTDNFAQAAMFLSLIHI